MLHWHQSTMRTYTWLFLVSCFVLHGIAEVLFGHISSPGYPEPYPPNQTMTWTISVPQGKRIKLQFTHFDVGEGNEHSQDYVKVIDVGQPLVTASGRLHAATYNIPEPLEFISVSSTLTLTFASRPVQSMQYRGFHAVYTVLGHDECANSKTPCAHYCHSYPAGYFCSCAHGYVLGRDNASCEGIDLLCTHAVPAYAKVEPKQESYRAGQEVTVTCLEGYAVVMSDQSSKTSYQATCQKHGLWDHYHHCQLVDCGPPQIDDGYITYLSHGNSTTYAAAILYTCKIYYELSPPGNGIYRCLADGEWVNSQARTGLPKCVPVCGVTVNLGGLGRVYGGFKAEDVPMAGLLPKPKGWWSPYFR
ncbi:mannan-binding lectin serine protease 1-like [Pleurodeles waltl]|uniref:mannan-binding lectin serine protease 1-like n=1 Tax=Pleurodeles waltl TaxID=8319 RepID=UPI0037095A68